MIIIVVTIVITDFTHIIKQLHEISTFVLIIAIFTRIHFGIIYFSIALFPFLRKFDPLFH